MASLDGAEVCSDAFMYVSRVYACVLHICENASIYECLPERNAPPDSLLNFKGLECMIDEGVGLECI